MSKSSKPRKRRVKRSLGANPDRSATTDVVTQLECAIRHPQATLIGALVGGVVPWFASTLAHKELPSAWSAGHHAVAWVMLAVVIGCACFSGLTVYKFGRATFGDARKALGFVLAIEGVMLVSSGTTSTVALGILIAINALANGSAIALAREATCRRREADVRRAATRSRKRSEGSAGTSQVRSVITVKNGTRGDGASSAPVSARWSTLWDDAVDAEIISETKLLS